MKNTVLGERIATLRAEFGETQQELADALDVKRETVKFWESGDRQIKSNDIVKLARHFEVSADYILGLSEAMSTNLEVQAVSQYTGLNEASLNTLKKIKESLGQVRTLNLLLSTISENASSREVIQFSASLCHWTSELEKELLALQKDNSNPDWKAMRDLFANARWFRFDAIDSFTRLVDDISRYQHVRHMWETAAADNSTADGDTAAASAPTE